MVSADNSLVFVTTTTDGIVCLDADSGRVVWRFAESVSGYLTEAKFREVDGEPSVIYAISVSSLQHRPSGVIPSDCYKLTPYYNFNPLKALNGAVQQLDVNKGTANWSWDCELLTGVVSCEDSVEAEFR